MHRLVRALWPVALWMGVVFTLSTDLGSATHTSRILTPVLRWLHPSISAGGIELAHLLVRKTAHTFEYAVMALLLIRALRITWAVPRERWSWPMAGWALAGAAGYAMTDELHQYFVGSRGASPYDVMIDTGGAMLGLLLAYTWTWWRSRRGPPPMLAGDPVQDISG
ncbi:VanZ family protein [Opitutus sp. ER46]|uniref:VanZ family protein n=1 Tax=Opitutus sp. ER46 TaxID=2161864 RepID=UPI000D31CFD9|nr:VanZ family protein [Opitutus sp. ER46]PTX94354.1 hypothetical protein DB354_11400 [Opitutus sp. ER46]